MPDATPSRVAMPPVPKQVTFPFGYRVKVRRVAESHPAVEGCYGSWNDDARTIFLRKDLSGRHLVYVFVHELMHATLDFQHWCVLQGYAGEPATS